MYPRLADLLFTLFGIALPIPLYSFGTMVFVGLVAGASLAKRELGRLYDARLLPAVEFRRDASGARRAESPAALVWRVLAVAAIAGVIGARALSIFDDSESFWRDPVGVALSGMGLTFYGGLITATLAVAYYVQRHGLSPRRVADALAPGLMLGYGLGRIGCYLSGDGDWGVCSSLANKPGPLPAFLFSESFPHNVLGVDVVADTAERMRRYGLDATRCIGADGVFPTMLYEAALSVLFCAVLWSVRKHPFQPGWLFGVYLIFNGAERFAVEMIRLNPRILFGLTEAQVVAASFVLAGIAAVVLTSDRQQASPSRAARTASGE